jgi:hypothetical protein
MNSKSFNGVANRRPPGNFSEPVLIKIKPSDVRFTGKYPNEEIILNTNMSSNDISQINDRIVSITYNNLSQFFKVIKLEALGFGSTITAKPLEKALIDPLWSNKIKGEFFILVETARNILPEPNKLNFELADTFFPVGELNRIVEELLQRVEEKNATIGTVVDAFDPYPDITVTEIGAMAETPAFAAKSYVINSMNVFTTLNGGKQVITIPKTLTGKTITLGLTHDDTTQNCSQDEVPKYLMI